MPTTSLPSLSSLQRTHDHYVQSFVLRSTRPDIHYRFGLLSSLATAKLKKIPTSSSGSTAHNMFVVLESRVHETNVINLGWEEMSTNWVGFWGGLKNPEKGVILGGSKKGSKKGSKTPLFGTPKSGK